MSKICPECQTLNDENESFCKNCGINLVDGHKNELSVNDNGVVYNEWAQRLFYWPDKTTQKYRLSKSKIISEAVFSIGFIYALSFYFSISSAGEYNVIMSVIASVIIALIFSVPVFAICFLIHYLLNK
ncbi:hypothetical protein [Methanobrevibacter sp.]|uniref:hypothetical protein n=1 Tax=Methanobrevibacter sp. TaxID=66852 RepID=UPI00388FB6C2